MATTAVQSPVPISWSIQGTANIPPLTMLVNPANLDCTYTPLITETRTLGGFVHEYWGEQLTSLSASGRTAMFIDRNQGLTNKDSRSTESYQFFMSLLNIYKNNGKGYNTGFTTSTTPAFRANPTKIQSLGVVSMVFDKRHYDGYFESFTYAEDALMPFTLDYTFVFRAMRIIGQLTI